MNQEELLALIAQAKTEGWTELDLSHRSLETLPEELASLTELQTLDLSGLNLSELPQSMAQLTNLEILNIRGDPFSNNNLSELPQWMAQLTNLHTLDLSGLNLSELPRWMAQLTNLHTLPLSSNNLSELPQWMVQLTNLHTLDLSNNNLSELPQSMAQLTNLHTLDISSNNLSELPQWMAQLTNLHTLDLRSNNLSELPQSMAQLTSLEILRLGCVTFTVDGNIGLVPIGPNMLSNLPEWMAQLINLHTLGLSGLNLSALPEWIVQLTNLQVLDFTANNLSELPQWMAQLTSLHTLILRSNNLSELPQWMAQLTNLHTLYLSNNNLSELPQWMANDQSLPRLRSFYIGENPITEPPSEVLGKALKRKYVSADIDEIRGYFRQLAQGEAVYFYEAKLLIIGEGGAGKTSLARKLLDPDCNLDHHEDSTEGIDILPWHFDLPSKEPSPNHPKQYTANIWDFGGQEIYFATHQFFLTKRSVYLLVADTRRQHTDFYDWLRMQETFGEASPVILVKNRNRQHGNSFTIENLPQLQERFPNMKVITEVDLDEVPDDGGWRDLIHHVQEELLNLPHIGQPRPETWVAVRKAIDVDERDIIRWSEFLALCREQGMDRDDDIQQLGVYLNNLGDVLYFHEDAVLCNHVILKPTWGLDAVYAVLDNEEVTSQLGEFSRVDLRSVWSDPTYDDYHEQLLRLMQRFQLCYELHDQRDTYIAPQLLTDKSPADLPDFNDSLQMRYYYPVFMPRGILSRAIVKLHQHIQNQEWVWRSGVILDNGSAQAEVLELRGDKQIRIRVSGGNRQDLLTEIRIALDDLHKGFPKLRVERQIPCNCATCVDGVDPHFYTLAKLQERIRNRKATVECDKGPHYHDVEILGLLSDFPSVGRGRDGREMNIHAGRVYLGDHREGDDIDVGNISDSTGLGLGRNNKVDVKQTGDKRSQA